jgi:DNA ligase-associated metallophosphoesterase
MNGESKPTPSVPLSIRGQTVELLGGRGVYWRDADTLFIADVHLGKAQTLQFLGAPVPATAILRSQLAELSTLIDSCGAHRVIVLGDLLHAPAGLTDDLVSTVGDWIKKSSAAWELVPGNHDRRIDTVAPQWNLTIRDEVVDEGPFRFVHHALEQNATQFTWSGHLHPAVTLGSRADRIRLPCFRVSPDRCILPAFSRFTAGASFEPEKGERLFAIAEGQVLPVCQHI